MKNYTLHYHVLVPGYLGGSHGKLPGSAHKWVANATFQGQTSQAQAKHFPFQPLYLGRVDSEDSFRTQRKGW